MFDHGVDPVVVENNGQYPSGPPPPGPGPHMARPPPPPGHINLGIPPPGFFPNRMQAPAIHVRPGMDRMGCMNIACDLLKDHYF